MKNVHRLSRATSSLYRLFLRGISASVLHHSTATKNLRMLWRHSFIVAARVEAEKQNTKDPKRLKVLDKWISCWNERVDNTLHMLLSSATSRGLSHQLTRNLGFLTSARIESHRPKRPSRVWDPHLPADSPRYMPAKAVHSDRENERFLREKIDADVFHALEQVVRLAEGRSGITLGRFPGSHRA